MLKKQNELKYSELPDYVKEQKKQNRKNKGKVQTVNNLLNPDEDDRIGVSGERFSVCKVCGKVFEQDYVPDRNAYQNFDTCHSCRWKLALQSKNANKENPKESVVSTATIKYNPYPWQIKARDEFKKHRFNVWAMGNRCLVAGTMIQGCWKPVEEIEIGDKVFSANGELQEVVDVGSFDYDGDLYTFKAKKCLPFTCNDEHPILIAIKTKDGFNESFMTAKEIEKLHKTKKQKIFFKIPKFKRYFKTNKWILEDGTEFPLNEKTAWILGLYCAEGCFIAHSLKWTLDYKKPELAQKVVDTLEELGYHTSERIRPDEGTHCVLTYKRALTRRVVQEIGHGSTNKHIPYDILLNENENLLIEFLKGYFAGDGYWHIKSNTLKATTVSHRLATDLQLAGSSLGYCVNLFKNKQRENKKCNIEYEAHINEVGLLELLGYKSLREKEIYAHIKTDNGIYVPLDKIIVEKSQCKIYHFETQDHTFVQNNQIQHNSGKDFCANMIAIEYFVECLNENRYIEKPEMAPSVLWWIIAPTEPMAKQNWRDLKKQFPKDWIVACSDSTFQMETIGGGIIEVKSAYNPESLVGVGLDLVTITEAARIDYNKPGSLALVWANLEARLGSPGRGLDRDRKGKTYGVGKAIINSSPLGKNYFYEMFKWGQKGSDTYDSNWYSIQEPWTCNPSNQELAKSIVKTKYGNMTYEESLRRRLGDRKYRENYLADFLAGDGSVFKEFEEKCVVNVFNLGLNEEERKNFIADWQTPKAGHIYRIGYDPATGSSGDDPAIVIRDKINNNIVWQESLYGKNYEQQWDRIAYLSRLYNYAECAWLRTGHTSIENQLSKRGVLEIPLDEQGGKKGEYVQSLESAVQNGIVKVLADGKEESQTLILQMNDYTEVNKKYSNNTMEHDDYVSAMYAAFYDFNIQGEINTYFCSLLSDF